MTDFLALKTRINEFLKGKDKRLTISGSNLQQFFLTGIINSDYEAKTFLVLAQDESEAEELYNCCKSLGRTALYFGLDRNPYSGHIFSHTNQYYRFRTLFNILIDPPKFLITTHEAVLTSCPPPSFFKERSLSLLKEDIISPNELATHLVKLGFSRFDFIEEPGQFSLRGEIFDIYVAPDLAIRINYFDELIESIHKIDLETKKTLQDQVLDAIHIGPTPLSLTANAHKFRENLPASSNYSKDILDYRNSILDKVKSHFLFDEYPIFIAKFFEEQSNLLDYISKFETFVITHNLELILDKFEVFKEEMSSSYEEAIKLNPLLPSINEIYKMDQTEISFPKTIDINEVIIEHENFDEKNYIPLKLEPVHVIAKRLKTQNATGDQTNTQILLTHLKDQIQKGAKILFALKKQSSQPNITHLLETWSFTTADIAKIKFIHFPCSEGFFYANESTFVISESDLFGSKKSKIKKVKSDTDLFAEQISTLKVDDYVIHKEHGVGKYLGLQNLTFDNKSSDFLVIEYKDSDKVYVPVYRMDLIQKYSDSLASVNLASLKSNKFIKEKQKARESVKKLAFDLLELNAKRKLAKGYAFSPPNDYFHEFEKAFPFEETPDQLSAINDVLYDMQQEQPMDRLVCGDVGFGKTEVAMRAAFKAVLDHKQVALLVPTTVLAYQHYNSFLKRFADFPVQIEFLSRFKTAKETAEIIEKLKKGQIDIVIGTHKLLADKVQFQDLGLLIIDEEQRFGVGHKEKIKNLRTNVDCLTLTATPIPRTLQMSFLGIRDLSLIRTAPPKKQSIKTYVIKENPITVKQAIDTELSRGGQVFIVHNKVHDIEEYTARVRKLVPYASIIFAHGQLNERELEKRIKAFYDRKYDILISTTIIESGIDIPTANTMIVDRADTYGLAQLHQLRGRIGRSDKKAYAYLSIPSNKLISEIATKRLKTLQTYADMGAGFSISSVDLEIRGSGDILGAEQSGHIQNIGLELYMDLLEETMNELKGKKETEIIHNIEIQTPYPAYIPNNYITTSSHRLKYYKRLSGARSSEALNNLKMELVDIYGVFPESVENLFTILEARIHLQTLPIQSVKVANKSVLIKFDENVLNKNQEVREKIINFFLARPKVYKLNPDYSVKCSFKEIVDKNTLLEFSKHIAQHI